MQQTTENGPAGDFSAGNGRRALPSSRGKWCLAGFFARMLLALLHLLDECLGLLLIGEGQTGGTVLELKCMEKSTVLVVGKMVVDLLVPDHALSSGLQASQR